jgi:hypothetical protein
MAVPGARADALIDHLESLAVSICRGGRESRLVVLRGPSGLGKTAALRELHQRLCEQPEGSHWSPLGRDAPVLERRRRVSASRSPGPAPAGGWDWVGLECGPAADGEPGGVRRATASLLDLLEAHVEVLDDERRRGVERARTTPGPTFLERRSAAGDRRSRLDRRTAPGREHVPDRRRRVDRRADGPAVVEEMVVDLAGTVPMVVAVDDLHVADDHTLDFVGRLLGRGRVLVVATAWPAHDHAHDLAHDIAHDHDPVESLITSLRGATAEVLSVVGMDADATVDLVRDSEPLLSAGDAAVLAERAAGVPLAVRVLLDSQMIPGEARLGRPAGAELLDSLPAGAVCAEVVRGPEWLRLALVMVVRRAAEALLADPGGRGPMPRWVADLDERLAVWIDPVLQQLCLLGCGRTLDVEEVLALHRWAVDVALGLAVQLTPQHEAAIESLRPGLRAAGLLAPPSTEAPPVEVPPASVASVEAVESVLAGTAGVATVQVAAVTAGRPDTTDTTSTTAMMAEVERRLTGRGPTGGTGDLRRRLRAAHDRAVAAGDPDGEALRLAAALAALPDRRKGAGHALERLGPIMAEALVAHGPTGRPTLDARRLGARLLILDGRAVDAAREADCLLECLADQLGSWHPETVAAGALLGEALLAGRMFPQAVDVWADVHTATMESDGPASRPALEALLGLAESLQGAGRRVEAAVLLPDAVERAEADLGPNDDLATRLRRSLSRATH